MSKAKRYLVFAGKDHHPAGGWSDLMYTTDDPEKAIKTAEGLSTLTGQWAEVIDLEVGLPVWRKR